MKQKFALLLFIKKFFIALLNIDFDNIANLEKVDILNSKIAIFIYIRKELLKDFNWDKYF